MTSSTTLSTESLPPPPPPPPSSSPSTSTPASKFVMDRSLKLLLQGFQTNFVGLGRDDEMITKLITIGFRRQNIELDNAYRSSNTQNQTLGDKFETFGAPYGSFLSYLVQSTPSIYGTNYNLFLDFFLIFLLFFLFVLLLFYSDINSSCIRKYHS